MKNWMRHNFFLVFVFCILSVGLTISCFWLLPTSTIALATVIPDRNIGTIMTINQPVPSASQIKSALKADNHNQQLLTADVAVTNISTNSADINGLHPAVDEINYRGSVKIGFDTKIITNLTQMINQTKIGTIAVGTATLPSETQIKTAIQKANPTCDLALITVKQINQNQAIIAGIDDANHCYTDVVTVYFQTTRQIAINTVIQHQQLGNLEIQAQLKPTPEQIMTALIAANQSVAFDWTTIQITNITNTRALAISSDPVYFGTLKLTFVCHQTFDLTTQIPFHHLGTITIVHQAVPTVAQIKAAIQLSNPHCNVSILKVNNINTNTAIISAINQPEITYYNQVVVDYQLNQVIALAKVLQQPNLGTIAIGRRPTISIDEVATAIMLKNHEINLQAIRISNLTDCHAVVIGDNQQYDGQVIVNFIIVQRKAITTVITQPALAPMLVGQHNQPEVAQIIAAIKAQNPTIIISDLQVAYITGHSAEITGTDYYYGLINVYFQIYHFQTIATKQPLIASHNLLSNKQNQVYVATTNGISQLLVNNQMQPLVGVDQACIMLGFDHEQRLYVSVQSGVNSLIYQLINGQLQLFQEFGGQVNSLMVDEQDQLYFGLESGWITVIKQQQIVKSYFLNGVSLYCLYRDAVGHMYAGTNNGIYQCQLIHNLETFHRISNISTTITQIISDQEHLYALSSEYDWYNNQYQVVYQSQDGHAFQAMNLPTKQIKQITINAVQRLFLATNLGVYYHDQNQAFTKIPSLDTVLSTIICSNNQTLWLSDSNGSIYQSYY